MRTISFVVGVLIVIVPGVYLNSELKLAQYHQEQVLAHVQLDMEYNTLRLAAIDTQLDVDAVELENIVDNSLDKPLVYPIPPNLTPVECLAKNIYYESGNEPYAGKVAVAQVTMNRVHAGIGGHDVCSVVYFKILNPVTHKKEAAFSWTLGSRWRGRGFNHSVYKKCLTIAHEMLNGQLHSTLIGPDVVHYYADYIPEPKWAENHQFVVQIGEHEFYE